MVDFSPLQYLYLKTLISISRGLAYGPMRSLVRAPRSTRTLIEIPTRDPTRFIKAWLHQSPYRSRTTPGLLINWHGSGFILPSLGMDHEFCDRIANEAGVVVIDADYPVSGFSAGANLALVAASELRGHFKKINIRAAYAFYPLVDLARDPAIKKVPHPINPFPVFSLRLFATCYVPKVEQRKDPRVSPIFADPAIFPALTIIFTCGADNLLPEAEEMAEKLKAGGANVEVIRLKNAAHGFDKAVKPESDAFKQREIAYSKVVQHLKSL
ncbi:hypothetical protein ACJA88_013958 [Fusarium oxysporum]